jgi:hypothetical protein
VAAELHLRPCGHQNRLCHSALRSFIEMYSITLKYATVFFKNAYSTLCWARNRYKCDGVTKDNGIVGHY